jgi:hypothetical protein
MLHPSQISDMKHKDPDMFNLFRAFEDAINQFALQMGVDPKPAHHVTPEDAIPAPQQPKSIQVVSIAGAILVLLEAGADNLPTTFYFVESSDTATFNEVTLYTLGHGLHLAVPSPAGVTYWRANCKYQMSAKSPYTVYHAAITPSGGTGSGGVTTPSIPTSSDVGALMGLASLAAGVEADEPLMIPGSRGVDGVIGRDGAGLPGPPGLDADEPDVWMLPGTPGGAGAAGAPSTVPGPTGPPGPDPEEPEFPMMIRGDRGEPGEASTVPGPMGAPGMDADPPDEPWMLPGTAGAAGAAGASIIGPPGLDADPPEEPMMIPGPRGADGAGGSGNSGSTTVDFGAFPGAGDASIAVTGQASIAAASIVRAWLQPKASADHSADEHVVETLDVYAGNIVAGTGFTIYARNTNQVNEPNRPEGFARNHRSDNSVVGNHSAYMPFKLSVGRPSPLIYGVWNVAWSWQ